MPKLSDPLEERFCIEYSRHSNGDRAVIAAGYQCKSLKDGSTSASARASYLLKQNKIAQRIAELHEKRLRAADVSVEYVLTRAKQVVTKCLREMPLLDREGRQTGVTVMESPQGANGALKLIGDYLRMFEKDPGKYAGATIHNTQVNVYVPENSRYGALRSGAADQTAGAGSARPNGAPATPGRATVCLPSNGHSNGHG